ncbi:MAG: hypothetical protein WAO52_10570 [Prolixibacteraceae bacterium]
MTDIHTNPEGEIQTPEEKALNFEKYKFIFELVKWFIGSVALVVITIIIDKGFKERSAGLQEMQAYDKYVEVILKADNIEERWKLSEYFSTVTPTERLRERWIAYKDSINADYIEFKKLKEAELELQNQKNAALVGGPVSETDQKLLQIQSQLAPFEKKLFKSENTNSAQDWEEKGFLYLLNHDVDNAISAFRTSENTSNAYHQVYEIARYLSENKSKLADSNSEFWKTANRKIASDFSWGMSAEIKNKLIEDAR